MAADEPERVQPDRQLRLSVLLERALVELDVGREPIGVPADDRQHERQAEARGAHDRLGAAADADPGRDVSRGDRRAHELVVERRPELPRPGHGLLAQQAHEQVELLLEQLLVVGEVEAEERERVGQRAAADDQLCAAVRDGVERGEVGVEAHRVLRAQHGDGGAEPDPFGAAGDRGEDDRGRPSP